MRSLGAVPGRIVAAVGPCIGFASYEVGPEFHQGLVAEEPACTDLFAPSARVGHFLFDLAGYVGRRLDRIGLRAHAAVGRDTCAEPEQFFSFRRDTIAGAGDYGRQISAIVLYG
jgi:copper oxidase (laccase) domain-containing protein